MRPAAYIRISGAHDQIGNLSLATQAQILRDFAARQGQPEPALFEESRSAFTDDLERRPVFAALVAAIERGEYDTLICYDQDRLARDAALALVVANRLTRAGCRIVLLNQPASDVTTPDGKLMFTVGAGISEYYSAQIARKTRDGLAHIAAGGGFVGGLTFGARRDAAYRREVDPARAADLRLLLTLAAEHGYGTVAELLNRRGVRPPKSAPIWRDTTVRSVVLTSRWLLDQPAPWPRLWSAAATRPRLSRANARKSRRMLTGLMRCACGGVIVYSGYNRHADGTRHYGVQCRTWGKDRPHGSGCPHRKRQVAHYEALMTRALTALPDLRGVDLDPPDTRAARAALSARRVNLARAVARGLPDAEADAIEAEILAEELALPLDAGTEAAVAEETIIVQGTWDLMTPVERNDALRRLVVRVVIEGYRLRVEWVPALVRLLDAAGFRHGEWLE